MNTASAFPGDGAHRTLVWDAPVRMIHWLLVTSFAVAWISSDSDRWQLVHITAGYTVAGLVLVRVLWGFVGTRHARFSDFVRGPGAALAYLRTVLRGRPEHHVGHNPAGGLAILALLTLAVITVATGWANDAELGGDWVEELHEALAEGMLALVGLHVVAVIATSWLHRENLVAAMIHGRKPVPAPEGIRRPWRGVAALVLAGVLAFWWMQWQSAPDGDIVRAPASTGARERDGHDED